MPPPSFHFFAASNTASSSVPPSMSYTPYPTACELPGTVASTTSQLPFVDFFTAANCGVYNRSIYAELHFDLFFEDATPPDEAVLAVSVTLSPGIICTDGGLDQNVTVYLNGQPGGTYVSPNWCDCNPPTITFVSLALPPSAYYIGGFNTISMSITNPDDSGDLVGIIAAPDFPGIYTFGLLNVTRTGVYPPYCAGLLPTPSATYTPSIEASVSGGVGE